MVREREPMGMGGEELMAGLGVIDVIIGLGWAHPRRRSTRLGTLALAGLSSLAPAGFCVCVCV